MTNDLVNIWNILRKRSNILPVIALKYKLKTRYISKYIEGTLFSLMRQSVTLVFFCASAVSVSVHQQKNRKVWEKNFALPLLYYFSGRNLSSTEGPCHQNWHSCKSFVQACGVIPFLCHPILIACFCDPPSYIIWEPIAIIVYWTCQSSIKNVYYCFIVV